MTADKYQFYWMSNSDWWENDENGEARILPTAPEEAQKSYQYYIEKKSRYEKMIAIAANTPPDEADD